MSIDYNKLVFFDTETTSISPPYIISLAYIAFQNGKKVSKGQIICNPDYPINPEASKVNGFTDDMVKDKPFFNEEWGKIKRYFENAIWIGHNSSNFDWRALKTEAQRYGITMPNHLDCDTLKNAKRLIPKDKVENYKLETLIDFFKVNVKSKDFHSADFDTWACMKIYNKLVELADGNLLIEQPK